MGAHLEAHFSQHLTVREVSELLRGKRRDIYLWLISTVEERGRVPTQREIAVAVGGLSLSVVNYHLKQLARDGLLERIVVGQSTYYWPVGARVTMDMSALVLLAGEEDEHEY